MLDSVVKRSSTERDVSILVRVVYEYALIRLRQLISSGKLHLESFEMSLEGTAFDCIGELFRRDEEGSFVELLDYFSGEREPHLLGENDARYHLRVLVFSKVRDAIFRLYRENDPVLGRILRNLKITFQKNRKIVRFERLGLTYACACNKQKLNEHLPPFPLEELESELLSRSHSTHTTKDLLARFFEIVNGQDRFRRFVSITDIAVIFKRVMTNGQTNHEMLYQPDDNLLDMNLEEIVNRLLVLLKEQFFLGYVKSGKIESKLFNMYWLAISDMMKDVFLRNDGSAYSHPDYLMKYMPALSRDAYRTTHRIHFEYLVRVTKGRLKKELLELL